MGYEPPILRGPVRDPRFPDDSVAVQHAPIAGIAAVAAVVSKDKVLEVTHHLRPPRAAAIPRDVGFLQADPIDEDLPSTIDSVVKGEDYSYSMVGIGGKQPYAWALVGGALPTGITLNPNSGVISTIKA